MPHALSQIKSCGRHPGSVPRHWREKRGDERVQDFHSLKDEIDDIKVKAAQRRLESIEADLELLRGADEEAYRELKERLRNLVRD